MTFVLRLSVDATGHVSGLEFEAEVKATKFRCNPVQKTATAGFSDIVDPGLHYVCYVITPKPKPSFDAQVYNQFFEEGDVLDAKQASLLCAPSGKLLLEPSE